MSDDDLCMYVYCSVVGGYGCVVGVYFEWTILVTCIEGGLRGRECVGIGANAGIAGQPEAIRRHRRAAGEP